MCKTPKLTMIVSIRKYTKINFKENEKYELHRFYFSVLINDINFSVLPKTINNKLILARKYN